MRIAIIAPGTQGDVRPYVALGVGLRTAGHAVRVVTHLNFETLVTCYGLGFCPLQGDTEALMRDQEVGNALAKNNPIAQLSLLQKNLIVLNQQWVRDCLDACQEADVVIGGFGGVMVGQPVAEKLGLPFVQAWLVPFLPTRAFPAVTFPMMRSWLGGRLNRLSHVLGWRLLAWPMQRTSINLARRNVLGLPRAPYWDGPLALLKQHNVPVLHGFSPHVIPRPSDWEANVHITGYWFLEPPPDWQPPAELVDFLRAGPPPVYVGFGSMSHGDPQTATCLVLEALQLTGQRGVLLSGWGGLSQRDIPASIYMADSIPHSWLFPQMAAVVHHGGAGTTAAGLRAGTPTITAPFISLDQNFWGWRVADLGVGLPPITAKRLTAEKLAQAITTATTDPVMRQRASELGAKIRSEDDGVAQAVAILREIVI
ncbi:vancomycin aglycone glucosyltransferase [Thermoflexales bacterium]|nr:vancomycin aglycone glucosyltransferase [Thermoflexales bacterium]